MSAILLLTQNCSSKKSAVETCARDYCIIASKIIASPSDKTALKNSPISKDYIKQIADHNDIYDSVCKDINKDLSIIESNTNQP